MPNLLGHVGALQLHCLLDHIKIRRDPDDILAALASSGLVFVITKVEVDLRKAATHEQGGAKQEECFECLHVGFGVASARVECAMILN